MLALGLTSILSGCSLYGQPSANVNSPAPVQPAANANEPAAASATVAIANFAFAPASLTVKAGDTVTWQNNDSAAHTIVSSGGFQSGVLNQGNVFSYTFSVPGQYQYYCGIHPSMKGAISVK